MTDNKVSTLTSLTGADLASGDVFNVVDVSAGALGSKKISTAEMTAGMMPGIRAGIRPYANAINLVDMGAVADSATDNTAIFQAALDAGGRIYLPPAPVGFDYRITAPLLVTRPVHFFGSGERSLIGTAANFTITDDVFRIIPVAVVTSYYTFENFSIGATSLCRHGIHADLTTSVVAGLVCFEISRVTINVNNLPGTAGRSFKLTNPTNNDGFAGSRIRGCVLYGGIQMQRCGDSVWIEENIFGYVNTAIDLSFTSGAAQVIIQKNNITSAGGAIILHNALQCKIRNNQIEQPQAYTGPEAACITLKGDVAQCSLVEIQGNNINTQGNVTYGIDVQGANDTQIFDNAIVAGGAHIRVGAAAVRTVISRERNLFADLSYARVEMVVTNAGTGTVGPWFTLTPANGWTVYDAVNYPIRYSKNEAGIVTVEGALAAGTTAAGTAIFTLPAGFGPATTNLRIAQPAVDGSGVFGIANLLVTASGQVQFWSGASNIMFMNFSFKAGG